MRTTISPRFAIRTLRIGMAGILQRVEWPAMIPLSRNCLGAAEEEALRQVLLSGFLVQGQKVAAFEGAVRERLGVGQAVAVSSGTAALHLALWSLGIGPG